MPGPVPKRKKPQYRSTQRIWRLKARVKSYEEKLTTLRANLAREVNLKAVEDRARAAVKPNLGEARRLAGEQARRDAVVHLDEG